MRNAFLSFLVAFVCLGVICVLTGRSVPHLVPDSDSYTRYAFDSATSIAVQTRTPAYPALIRLATWIAPSSGQVIVVWFQIALHALAVSMLCRELVASHLARVWAIAAGLTVAIGCTFWDHGDTIATDAPAMSIGVIAGVIVLRAWRKPFLRDVMLIGVWTTLAIFLRPAYLFLIPWTMFALVMRPGTDWKRRVLDAVSVAVIPVVVLLGWCTFRSQSVGDFGLLPFGHQNMAAVTTQLLDADELAALPGDVGTLGRQIADRRIEFANRQRASADGLDLRPIVDAGPRADSYMTLENRWDAMTYLVVMPAAESVVGGTIVDQHRALADLDRTIVWNYPGRYAKWLALALRRGVWGSIADLVMHPVFFGVLMLAAVGAIGWTAFSSRLGFGGKVRSAQTIGDNRSTMQDDRSVIGRVTFLALSYWLAKIGFVALTSPPIGRFSDAAAVWLPVWIVVVIACVYDSFSISLSNASSSAAERSEASRSD